jgi:phage tail-like protein
MPETNYDAVVSNRFYLDLNGHKIDVLQEVSGIEDESDVLELQQATKSGKVVIVKSLGAMPVKGGKLTLKYAAFKEDPIKAWYDMVVNQKINDARTNISLVLYDLESKPTFTFEFANAWPSKYSFGSLTSKGNDPLAVTVTIEHTGMNVTGYNA